MLTELRQNEIFLVAFALLSLASSQVIACAGAARTTGPSVNEFQKKVLEVNQQR